MIQWGQRSPALPDAFRAAAEMFEGRVRSQGTLLETMLLPIMFLAILIFVGFFVLAMFLPLIALISRLSGELTMMTPEIIIIISAIVLAAVLSTVLAALVVALVLFVVRRLRPGLPWCLTACSAASAYSGSFCLPCC